MAYSSLVAGDIDAKSPITDALFALIDANLDDLDSRLNNLGTGGPFEWKYLNTAVPTTTPASQGVPASIPAKRIDGLHLAKEGTYTQHKIMLEAAWPGVTSLPITGTLEIDIRKYVQVNIPVQSITRIFEDSITSISEITPRNTQSITRATAQISTQSITALKSAINISSIGLSSTSPAGARLNLASALDADWQVGDYIVVAGASSGGNNGTFAITRINEDGLNNIIITNASAAVQAGAAGTVQLQAYKYNLTAAANSNFAVGEIAIFAGHTDANNDGSLTIYAVNSGGSNIVVKNQNGLTQGGIAGTIDCARLSYNLSGPASTEFVVGDSVVCASHTSANNDGTYVIRVVNAGGADNLILSCTQITLQGGAAGTIKSLLKVVNLNLDPTGSVSIGHTIIVSGGTNGALDGTYAARELKRGGTNNIVVYNATAGTGGAAGSCYSGRVTLDFSSDQSALFTTDSRIETSQFADSAANNGAWPVLAVNYGAANNVLIDNAANIEQAYVGGRIDLESKSLFATRPTINYATGGYNSKLIRTSSNGVFGAEAAVETGDMIGVDILNFPINIGTTGKLYVQVF